LRLSENRSLFKLFQNDVGLLAAQYAEGIALKMLSGEVNINYGAIYENLVAQELSAHGWNLRYFNSKKQGELDFVLEQDDEIIPIEVKSGKDYQRHAALSNVMSSENFGIHRAFVFSNKNVSIRDNVVYVPIYMTMFLRKQTSDSPLIFKMDMNALR